MKLLLLFIVSQGLWANTLLETKTTAEIANTLQGTAQGNPQQILNQVKDTANNYEQIQERKIDSIQAPPNSPPIPNTAEMPLPPPNNNPAVQPEGPQPNFENQNVLDHATLSDQERNQIQQLNQPASGPFNPLPLENQPKQSREQITENNDKKEITEDYFKTERIVEIEDKPINYKTTTQIFYKKDCQPSQSNCKRSGAVFTNIKSVIFNYAHSRGSFSEDK